MLNNNEINFFKENGYLIVKPNVVFNNKEIFELRALSDKYFLDYKKGYYEYNIKKFNPDQLIIDFNNIQYVKNGNTNNDNILNARRATCMAYQIECGLNKFVENEKLLSCAKILLSTKKLSLHTSSIIKVYPGCEGEPEKLHTDLPGFVYDPLSLVKKNKFVLNVLVYLCDVDKDLAPMRISSKTHRNYLKINSYLCLKRNLSKKVNLLHASDKGVDDKIIKNLNYEIKSLVGKSGTVIFMSGNTLHGATSNKSIKSRIHFNCNFSKREDKEIRKFNYQRMKKENVDLQKFINNFKDKKMLERSYLDTKKNFFLENYYKIKSKFMRIIND